MQLLKKMKREACLYLDDKLKYSYKIPYHPDIVYPELELIYDKPVLDPENQVYSAIRNLFKLMNLDLQHYDTTNWNPLGCVIEPGDNVLVKPNLVMHDREGNLQGKNAMHTHGAVIRVICDYVLLALKGKGQLIVADSPIQEADFTEIRKQIGLEELKEFYHENGINNFSYYDLRKECAVMSNQGMIIRREKLAGDPQGERLVDLGKDSALEPITDEGTRFSITNYNDSMTRQHHYPGKHEYLVSQTALNADVIINIPKLKTHIKTGITCCLKNMVGISVSKDYLPHHRVGVPDDGGDEYPKKTTANVLFKKVREHLNERSPQFIWNIARKVGLPLRKLYSDLFDAHVHGIDIPASLVYGGGWFGNDTTWRMVHDINKIAFYADKKGKIQKTLQRKYFAIVDAIVAGEGDGPLIPKAKQCGMLLAGFDPLAVDTLAALCMGFDPRKIPLLAQYQSNELSTDLDQMDVSLCGSTSLKKQDLLTLFRFEPPSGWKGHIES